MSDFDPLRTLAQYAKSLPMTHPITASLHLGIMVSALGCTGACDRLNPSELAITNAGKASVTKLSVTSTEGQSWSLGDLPPGETVQFSESLSGEGALQVEFTTSGKQVKSQAGCYYTPGGLNPADATVTIDGEQVRFDCRSG